MKAKKTNLSEGTAAASPWIYGPWLDLIVGCGAWSAPLLLHLLLFDRFEHPCLGDCFYALALFFNYPHYMATIYRAYHREEDFQKYRIFTVHITALIVLTLLLSHSWVANSCRGSSPSISTWSPWHYSGQNYGLFMMFARRAGARPSKAERRALYGAFITSYLDSVSELSFRTFYRSAFYFARNSAGRKPVGADRAGRGVSLRSQLWFVAPGAGYGLAKAVAIADSILVAVSLVSAAGGYFAD